MERVCTKKGTAHPYDPDKNFCCKITYMRENDGLNIAIPPGWAGPSWMSQERGVIAEAEANGYQPERVR